MAILKYMKTIILIFLMFGCREIIKSPSTFDYGTMSIVEKKNVNMNNGDIEVWVEAININEKRIELNVRYNDKVTRRIFINKGDHWYSELNYRIKEIDDYNQEADEIIQKYYIYENFLIKESESKNYTTLYYYDFDNNQCYIFSNVIFNENFNFEELLKGEYQKSHYNVIDESIIETTEYYEGVRLIGNTKEEVYTNSGLDYFFLIDLIEYKIGDDNDGYMEIIKSKL